MPTDPAFTLAEHVCQTTFAALPASAVHATRRDILDTLGAALGGSVAPGVAETVEQAAEGVAHVVENVVEAVKNVLPHTEQTDDSAPDEAAPASE